MARLRGTKHCFAHSPKTASKRKAASAKGGRRGRVGYGVPADVSNVNALQGHLAQVVGDQLVRPNGERRNATLARLIDVARRLIDQSELEARIAAVERKLSTQEGE